MSCFYVVVFRAVFETKQGMVDALFYYPAAQKRQIREGN
jgi:hypothetical protein